MILSSHGDRDRRNAPHPSLLWWKGEASLGFIFSLSEPCICFIIAAGIRDFKSLFHLSPSEVEKSARLGTQDVANLFKAVALALPAPEAISGELYAHIVVIGLLIYPPWLSYPSALRSIGWHLIALHKKNWQTVM